MNLQPFGEVLEIPCRDGGLYDFDGARRERRRS